MQKIGKYIPFITLILVVIFNACSSDNEQIDNSGKSHFKSNNVTFSFDTYERFRGELIDIRLLEIPESNTRLEQNNIILNYVNEYYNTNIDFDNSLKELESSEDIFNWLIENSDFNERDVSILTNFSSNLRTMSFDNAILVMEEELLVENIDAFKFENYQSIVNGVKIIEDQYDGFFTVESSQNSWGCAFALAKLALASASLVVACNPPAMGATVGTGCYLAVTSFIAASASVGLACGDD